MVSPADRVALSTPSAARARRSSDRPSREGTHDGSCWESVLEPLRAHGFRVETIDLPSQGDPDGVLG
jgi:hypothetical protein